MKDHSTSPITYESTSYSIKSGGYDSGNISSTNILDKQLLPSENGLNVVVYDCVQNKIVVSANF